MFRGMKENGFMFPSFLILFFVLALLLPARSVQGAMYKYADKNGTVIFTDCYDCIPQPYRDRAQKIRDMAPFSARPTEGGKEVPENRDGGNVSRPEPGNPAGEKIAGESGRGREEKEKNATAIREKQARLEELNARVAALQQEKSSLRTNWMVFDRIRFNQLNQEIEALQKEIQDLQSEIEEDRR
jgi:hypothetical protein